MVYAYNAEDAPSVRLRYAAELAQACGLPWSAVQGSSVLKNMASPVPESDAGSGGHSPDPLHAYHEFRQVCETDPKDPLRFDPCVFCSTPCREARSAGEALDAEGRESALLSFIIMNFDLLLPDLQNLKKSQTREWFFSLFKRRRFFGSVYGEPAKGDVLSYPVNAEIAKALYRIYARYSASAGEMDKSLSVPVLSPAFVLYHLENSPELFGTDVRKYHSGIAGKFSRAMKLWFYAWRTKAVVNKTVSPQSASEAFSSLASAVLGKDDYPPFSFNFRDGKLRSAFDSCGITFLPSGPACSTRGTEPQTAVPAENRSFGEPDPPEGQPAPAEKRDADTGNRAEYMATVMALMGTADPKKMPAPAIPCGPDMKIQEARSASAVPQKSKPADEPRDENESKPHAKSRTATKAGSSSAKPADIEKALSIAAEISKKAKVNKPDEGKPQPERKNETPDSMGNLLDAVPAGNPAPAVAGAAAADYPGEEYASFEKPGNNHPPLDEFADVEIPLFENLDSVSSDKAGFTERGTLDLSKADKSHYSVFAPDLSDWWFRMLGACDTVCVEPAERDGETGLLFYCHGMKAPEGSGEINSPFFIPDNEMFRSTGTAGFHHRIFDMGCRRFYTFHKPGIVKRLRSICSYSPGQLNEKIISMQPLLVCFYDTTSLADMELLASGSQNREALFKGNHILNIFKAYPDLYAELYDQLITNKPEYRKQIRWGQGFEYALGTADTASGFCNIEDPNLTRQDAVDCRFRFNRKTRINYRCLLVGLKFDATRNGEAVQGDVLKYLTALCIGRSFLVTQIIGANPILLSYRPAEAVFLIPAFGEKQEARMKERLLNAFAAFDNSFKSTVRELGFKIGSLQNLYSFGAQILESEVPEGSNRDDAKEKETAHPG